MLTRFASGAVLVAMAVLAAPGVAAAQQTFNFSLGYFTPRGEDARVEGDVLNANRNFLAFDIEDFNGASVGAEWLVPFGELRRGRHRRELLAADRGQRVCRLHRR